MNKQLTVVAKIVAKAGVEDRLEAELRRLVPPTRSEDGCVQYVLHRSIDDPCVFLFYETWTAEQDLEAHLQSPHFKAFQAEANELVDEMELLKLERLD